MSSAGLRDAQIAGKTLFLGVSESVFLEEISIWVAGLSKGHLPHAEEHHPILCRPE